MFVLRKQKAQAEPTPSNQSHKQKFPDNPHVRADCSISIFQPDFRIFMGLTVVTFSLS